MEKAESQGLFCYFCGMKMLQTITILLLLLLSVSVKAQNNNEIQWGWSDVYGNSYNSVANRLEVKDGFMYVAGEFKGELQIQGDTLLSSPTVGRPFVAKFDTNGVLQWATRLDWGNFINSLRIDSDGDVRILCDYGLMVIYNALDGTPITYYGIPDAISGGVGTVSDEYVLDFELDDADNMYILSRKEEFQTGSCYSKVTVYSTPYDTIINALWSDTIELGIFPSWSGPKTMSLDSNNNVYVSGMTDGITLSLNAGEVTGTWGMPELFALKYSPTGNIEWLNTNISMSTEIMQSAINMVDSSMYLTGYHFMEEVYHGDTITVDTTNQTQIVLLKYDLDGNHVWSRGYPLATKSVKTFPNASWGALGNEVQITDAGDVYFRGSFTGSIIFANDTLVEDTSTVLLGYLADDMFIAKLDPNGNPIWGKYVGNSGGVGNETGDFWVDPSTDNIHFVGYWADTNNLLKNTTPIDALKQIFVAREGGPSTVNVDEIHHEKVRLLVYPNPSEGIFRVSKAVNAGNFEYQVVDMKGRLLLSGTLKKPLETIDLSHFQSGVYFLQTPVGSTKLIKQ